MTRTLPNIVILLSVAVPLACAARTAALPSRAACTPSLPSPTADAVSSVVVAGVGFTNTLSRTAEAQWSGQGVTVMLATNGQISVVAPSTPLLWIELRWPADWPVGARVLCDAWERAYGELGWRDIAELPLFSPWYFLVSANGVTDGCGIEVQPNALAGWRLEKDALALHLDVSAGGDPVELGSRVLDAAAKRASARSRPGGPSAA